MLLISEADKSEIHKAAWQSENFLGKRWYWNLEAEILLLEENHHFSFKTFQLTEWNPP